MDEDACVLIYGNDYSLLETRRMVLHQAGLHVVTISRLVDLTQLRDHRFLLLVLCHTLPPKEQQEAIRVGQKANPALSSVVLTAYAPEFALGIGSSYLNPFDGPEALIALIRATVKDRSALAVTH